MFGLGFQELLIILVIALLFFGGNKLPEVASVLGKAVREFKRATSEPLEGEVARKASAALPAVFPLHASSLKRVSAKP